MKEICKTVSRVAFLVWREGGKKMDSGYARLHFLISCLALPMYCDLTTQRNIVHQSIELRLPKNGLRSR